MTEKFDAIVVGAGPGGCAAALCLAREGYDVLLLEKSKIPGHRNVTGGVIFGRYYDHYGLMDLVPEFESEAPLERRIMEHRVYALSGVLREDGSRFYKFHSITRDSLVSKLRLVNTDLSTGHDYSVLRARFDKWFVGKVLEAGGMVSTEKTVEDLLWDGGRVSGVLTPDEELYADVVIDAGGVTSTLVERASLRGKLRPEQVYHGVKHVYKLSEKVIEERLDLREGEGKALVFLGNFMRGVRGGAFLYTNRDTLSVGIVASFDSLVKRSVEHPDVLGKPLELLEDFESHPMISRCLEGGELVEYSAHNIPKGPKCILKKPYAGGFLVVGDALGAFTKVGPLIDGMRPAVATGIMATETYKAAKKANDFSEKSLSHYRGLLNPVYRDMRRSRVDSFVFESRFAYNFAPKLMFKLGFMVRKAFVEDSPQLSDGRDAIQRIQERTGLLDYDEDKEYSHITVNLDACAKSRDKPWVPACPFNCYTLVLEKGVFASFKDLYAYNLNAVRKRVGGEDSENERHAKRLTKEDIAKGQVRFDHVACVGCGACGVLGPKDAVLFGHERRGHGVKYGYG